MKLKKRILALAIGAVLGSTLQVPQVIAADDTKGFLRGTAASNSGQLLSGVTITIEDPSRGLSRMATTDTSGNYRFPALPTGEYRLVATGPNGEVLADVERLQVSLGGKTVFNVVQGGTLEEVSVVGEQLQSLDTSSAVKDFVVDTSELTARVPVARDLMSVALLAPSVAEGDRDFGGLPAFGGASVAENGYFINGLNITDPEKGTGGTRIPFEMVAQTQVKSGGYNAEFGRAIGGVMNTVTKRGSNEFHFGVNTRWRPASLNEEAPLRSGYGDLPGDNEDEYDTREMEFWASGAVIEDKLFYYALYNPRKQYDDLTDAQDGQTGTFQRRRDQEFWGVKLDWNITDEHALEYTGLNDGYERVEKKYLRADGEERQYQGKEMLEWGGESHIFKYTGLITDWLAVSAAYGTNEQRDNTIGENADCPVVYQVVDGSWNRRGCWSATRPSSVNEDNKEVARIDFDLYLGDHSMRFGLDREESITDVDLSYSGGRYQAYYEAKGDEYSGLNAGDFYVDEWIQHNRGSFAARSNAFYIQDEWAFNDRTTIHFGLRNEVFENDNGNGDTFLEMDNQWAPRFGISFDPTGDDSSRIYANWGRYFMPTPININIRMASAEFYSYYTWEVNGFDDATGMALHSDNPEDALELHYLTDGVAADPVEIVDANIEPMYQDEFILGYDWQVGDWNLGVRGVYRDLKRAIEDTDLTPRLNDYAREKYGLDADVVSTWVLINPGADVTVTHDFGEGPEKVTFSGEEMGLPEAERTYQALEFTFDRNWDEKWMLGGSLTLSKSEGNYEGLARSDNGQEDPNFTRNFDEPEVMLGSYGYLPNDRRWAAKLWSSYRFDNGIMLGANFWGRDGRPISCQDSNEAFKCGDEQSSRGAMGRTPDVYNLDLNVQYTVDMASLTGGELVLRADVYNVFNLDETIEVQEVYTNRGSETNLFGFPAEYQTPRWVELSANYRF